MFTLYRMALPSVRKLYRIGHLFTHKSGDLGAISVKEPRGVLYSTANDPQPQMIPRPQMIPKMDRKWSSTASDPQSRPQMIPKEK